MSVHLISDLPGEARLWVFGAGRRLAKEDAALLEERVPPFLERWTAHSRELRAGWALHADRFLLVAVDESRVPASGCSIDALMRHVGELEDLLGTSLLDGTRIWYREADDRVETVERDRFRRLAERGRITEGTPVFDPTLTTLADLRAGRLERPAGRSWHARLLPDAVSGPAGPGPA